MSDLRSESSKMIDFETKIMMSADMDIQGTLKQLESVLRQRNFACQTYLKETNEENKASYARVIEMHNCEIKELLGIR